ncbi:MAG: hypothetical protein KatS3mg108_1464 [Isosphaeraceae bacterium]|jgi:uncharacterized membrane protein required for colicin V production|nr:MAG: hypothetical protein KatS3mg108_1464 [Isosphaeraceae bacterium]
MGVDIALGALVLAWAVRGWFRGFLRQAVGLGALVGAIFAAAPLRDLARPQVGRWFPSIDGEILDRLLWWVAVVVALVVLAGCGGWLLRLMKRRSPGAIPLPSEPNRADQGAGFLLGALKGAVVASFLAAGLVRFEPAYLEPLGEGRAAVEEQTKTSKALYWAAQYRPAEQIWGSVPVQTVVAEIRRHGLGLDGEVQGESPSEGRAEAAKAAPGQSRSDEPKDGLRTAARLPELRLDGPRLEPGSPTFLEDVDREMKRLGLDRSGRR